MSRIFLGGGIRPRSGRPAVAAHLSTHKQTLDVAILTYRIRGGFTGFDCRHQVRIRNACLDRPVFHQAHRIYMKFCSVTDSGHLYRICAWRRNVPWTAFPGVALRFAACSDWIGLLCMDVLRMHVVDFAPRKKSDNRNENTVKHARGRCLRIARVALRNSRNGSCENCT